MQYIKKWFNGERQKLAPMTWGQRAEYIWEYYKIQILAICFLILFVIIGFSTIGTQKPVLLTGALINTQLSESGEVNLTEGYPASVQLPDSTVLLIPSIFIPFGSDQPSGNEANALMITTARIAAREIDFILTDEGGLKYYGTDDFCLKPEEYLPDTVSKDALAGEYAISLSQSRFVQEAGIAPDDCYLLFPITTKNADQIPGFISYLFN